MTDRIQIIESEPAGDARTPRCPLPITRYPRVLMAHGGGGRLMHELIASVFGEAFGETLQRDVDAATLALPAGRIAVTTDSFVVSPRHFPGGNIGELAVYGTVNDVATSGARLQMLTAAFILEEGLPIEELWAIVHAMAEAARRCGVPIVSGDTKVVERGKGDGVFINTTGIGILDDGVSLGPDRIEPGDVLIVNGDVGRHGMAVMTAREGLTFETPILSDAAPLHHLVGALLEHGIALRCVRDLTRGGLASALNEISSTSGLGISVDEEEVPVGDDVAAACEILGLDPLYVACEGRMVFFVSPDDAAPALEVLRGLPDADDARIIGVVTEDRRGTVVAQTSLGVARLLDLLTGEQLPRIC